MITEIGTDELVVIGARHRAAYLTEQAGYTLGIAAEESEELDRLLDAGYRDEVTAQVQTVRTAMSDKTLMEADTKEATAIQNRAYSRAKVWRRRVVKRGQRARRLGRNVPDALTRITRAVGVPGILKQMDDLVTGFRANLAAMGGASAQTLLDEGVGLSAELSGADAEQERKRLAALPAKVRSFFEEKGKLYIGLKVLNDAGQELHADESASAARYNLVILYRRAAPKKKVPENG